ncbi:MAG: 50S ribosomal protein L25/general stress protein Ctc [Lutibacter sp.]|uniref:50S ribosomal protein L25/general stress protein Ctc n=1 Tax=Lutibacter sp. TaxID=1925666 RepID=UPI001816CF60|nr:50S ribosomal protein L25/general stress protein Ctc [Lutibacter sp.]MBT8317912.1 50S ribosomal protein L25/general stress protein Ctc [Lutibacter sp.]NNJ58770.1 50S ribosomal protein L25/general stress protein Ctc [Lutibacter sp.]
MKSITISGSKRESVGKVATKALRNAGKVPCVMYGGDKPLHFSADETSFKKLVYTPNVYTATIELEGTKYHAILQDIQFHPVTDKILHIDFYQLFDDKLVTMNIPVRLIGTSPGVINGGSLSFPMRKLSVRALPANLPDFINADISKLKIGNKLVVSEVADDSFTILHPENTVVVQVRTARAALVELGDEEDEEDGEEGAEGGEESSEEAATE